MKSRKLNVFAGLIAALFITVSVANGNVKTVSENPVHQLRIYEIPKENREVFHERFKDHAMRIMKKYGFKIIAIWESETGEKVEFVYLLEWKDKQTMTESWKKFMADEEWAEIKKKTSKKHGTFVNGIQEKTLVLTGYSPQTNLLKK